MASGSRGSVSDGDTGGRLGLSMKNGGLTWTDIRNPTPTDMATLEREYHFHSLDLEDCLSERQLTKIEVHGDHVFLALRFPDEGDNGLIVSRPVSMFIGNDYLITIHPSSFEALSAIFQSFKVDEKEQATFMKSSAFLAYHIIDKLVDNIFSILDDVQVDLDQIEAIVFDEKKSSAGSINAARRQIAFLRRIVYPLALFLPDLAKAQKFSEENLSIYFSDLDHKVGKASRTIEAMKEMVEIYKDTDFVISSDRTNTVLSILTILFTLTIPATVISSIYGMNVPLPGGIDTGPLEFLGPYTSLIFIFAAMLIPAVLMAIYFKRVGWF
jgi:magnesium transporter